MLVDIILSKENAKYILEHSPIPVEFINKLVLEIWFDSEKADLTSNQLCQTTKTSK